MDRCAHKLILTQVHMFQKAEDFDMCMAAEGARLPLQLQDASKPTCPNAQPCLAYVISISMLGTCRQHHFATLYFDCRCTSP